MDKNEISEKLFKIIISNRDKSAVMPEKISRRDGLKAIMVLFDYCIKKSKRLKYARGLMNRAKEIMINKNEDYGAENNMYRSFEMCEMYNLGVTRNIMMTRICDKISRIMSVAIKPFGNNLNFITEEEYKNLEEVAKHLRDVFKIHRFTHEESEFFCVAASIISLLLAYYHYKAAIFARCVVVESIESVEDSVVDAINYLGMIYSLRGGINNIYKKDMKLIKEVDSKLGNINIKIKSDNRIRRVDVL